jgi:hypothetical protein
MKDDDDGFDGGVPAPPGRGALSRQRPEAGGWRPETEDRRLELL